MGAWGVGSFENDDALGWVSELERAQDRSLLEKTLRGITELGEAYLEAPEACEAVAAAEVVAELNHAGTPDLPEAIVRWINQHPIDRSGLTQLALSAVQRIRTNSELKELWDESDSKEEWHAAMSQLEARLKK
jgi:hypothetical protein